MKNIFVLVLSLFLSTTLMAAGGDSGGDSPKASLYDDAVKLVLHVPSFASLVYEPADEGAYVAEFELANTLEPFFH